MRLLNTEGEEVESLEDLLADLDADDKRAILERYGSAPAAVSVLLAGIVTKAAGIYTLIRIVTSLFPFDLPVNNLLMLFGTISIFAGALAAIGQDNFKRMLAYSSISQVGYMVLGLGTGTGGTGTYTVSNTQTVGASFTGTASGANLTASAVTGYIAPGDIIAGTGVPSGTTILSHTSGTAGGAGT